MPDIVAAAADLLRRGVGPVLRADQPGYSGDGGLASCLDAPRLVACLAGRPAYRLRREGGLATVRLAPGGILAIAPGCWVTALPRRRGATLGVICHPRHVRLLLRHGGQRLVGEAEPPDDALHHLCRRLTQAWDGPEPAAAERALAGAILAECARLAVISGAPGRAAWLAARAAIEEGCGGRLTRATVAAAAGVHPNHLARLLRRHSGTTFAQALRTARLERAEALLADPGLKLAAVARRCGFASASHLVRRYRLARGRTPGRERRRGSGTLRGG